MDRKARRELIQKLRGDATRIAARFELRFRAIEAERANVKSRYGVCFSDGTIRIRLNHVTTREPLRYSSLVSTLCHELAHLRHFNHGPRFQRFYYEILEFARDEGIYRPAPRPERAASVRDARPREAQLSLF
jgi:predicted metal-dependent hydrolase